MAQQFINNYETTITKPAGAGDTVLFLDDISRLPSIDSEGFFKLTIVRSSDKAIEIVKVLQINLSNKSVVVQRSQEGTFALGLSIGDNVSMNLTAGDLTDFENRSQQYREALEYLSGDILKDATELDAGILEIATTSEVNTATDHSRAVTPLKLKQAMDTRTDIGELGVYTDEVVESTVETSTHLVDRTLGGIHVLTMNSSCTLSFSMVNGDSLLMGIAGGESNSVEWDSVSWFGELVPVLNDGAFIQFWKINNQVYGKYKGIVDFGYAPLIDALVHYDILNRTGDTTNDLISSYPASLINGVTGTSEPFIFDGSNDYMTIQNIRKIGDPALSTSVFIDFSIAEGGSMYGNSRHPIFSTDRYDSSSLKVGDVAVHVVHSNNSIVVHINRSDNAPFEDIFTSDPNVFTHDIRSKMVVIFDRPNDTLQVVFDGDVVIDTDQYTYVIDGGTLDYNDIDIARKRNSTWASGYSAMSLYEFIVYPSAMGLNQAISLTSE
jgi:hypothetical protein